MKKTFGRVIAILIALCLSLSATSHAVLANSALFASTTVGSWQLSDGMTGKEIEKDQISTPNSSWLQLLSEGIEISGAGEICHPFRGGLHGWTGSIYELQGDTWTKMETTAKWIPDKEGDYYACAFAPERGTYALFGYYTEPPEKSSKKCDNYWLTALDADETADGGFLFYGTIAPAKENVTVSYRFSKIAPAGSITGAVTASTLTDADGNFAFTDPVYIDFTTITSFSQKFYINGCVLSLKL